MDKSDNELSRDVVIVNELGLHARSAAKIAKHAQTGQSGVWIIKDGVRADASSIIDVLTLACGRGTKITIQIDDRADLYILHDLVKLIESGFGE
jgi:phosphocarrier protein